MGTLSQIVEEGCLLDLDLFDKKVRENLENSENFSNISDTKGQLKEFILVNLHTYLSVLIFKKC